MKRQILTMALVAICVLMQGQTTRADILADGGPIITHPGGHTGVSGADRSAISPGGTLFGAGATGVNRLTDDFTVGGDFTINSITVYGYLTNATAPGATALTLQIWDGMPGSGGTVVWGDTTTNVLSTTGWADSPSGLGIFRTTSTDTLGTARRVQQMTSSGLNVNLAAGTYWLDFNFTGVSFVPSVSDPVAPIIGNSMQSLDGGATWNPALDAGTATQTAQPFLIEGTAIPEPGTLSLLAIGAVVGLIRRRK